MDYSNLTDEKFDELLAQIIDDDNPRASMLLSIPGVYDILKEEYNNDVLDRYENELAEAEE